METIQKKILKNTLLLLLLIILPFFLMVVWWIMVHSIFAGYYNANIEGCDVTGLFLDAFSEFTVEVFMPHLPLELITHFQSIW